MSSFNINGPSNKPQITEAQNMMNNGGGGNTGYLASGRKKKDKKKEDEIDPKLLEGEIEDKFERQIDEDEDDDDYYNTEITAQSENQNQDKPKHPLQDAVFGLINQVKVSKKPKDNNENKNKKDDNGGNDFLTLSKNI